MNQNAPPQDPLETYFLNLTRRQFFGTAAASLGAGLLGPAALASALNIDLDAGRRDAAARGLGSLGAPHTRARARRVIYIHLVGAPSQLDLFDYKPDLGKHFNQDLPDSIRMGQRLSTMTSGQSRFPVAPSIFKFTRCENNEDGAWISELLPYTQKIAKEMCIIRSMQTEAINHEPGITFFQTGTQQSGRPSFGSWVSYGLGSANADLPSFVVLLSEGFGNTQAISARLWSSGFVPSEHQGCQFRSGESPVLFLRDPEGLRREDRRRMLDLAQQLNEREFARSLDPEVKTRIAQAEMAYRMQVSVPELTDLRNEDARTLQMYGPKVLEPGSFANHCLLARRLAERGVRFIQLYNRGWDQHGNLPSELKMQCDAADQPWTALVLDLKRRGMLDDTLVIWAGEFGRTAYSQGDLTDKNYGRDHHPRCFTIWLAGGGIKPGISYGKTDDYSYNIVENPVEVHDLHATLLHVLGIEHEKLIYRYQGRDYRLTDVFGEVLSPLLS